MGGPSDPDHVVVVGGPLNGRVIAATPGARSLMVLEEQRSPISHDMRSTLPQWKIREVPYPIHRLVLFGFAVKVAMKGDPYFHREEIIRTLFRDEVSSAILD